MASYNELLALIDAYINQNGVQAITGQVLNGVLRAMVDQLGRGYSIMGAADPTTDPGTPDGPETWFASVPGTYTNFDGIQIVDGELALLSYVPSTGFSKNTIYEGFQTVQATIDGNVGTPAVGVSYANGILSFDFHNMKGVTGDPAGFGAVTASVDSNIGTPSVQVQTSGPDTAKAIAFQFHNLKGETGVTSVLATVDNTSGNPQCAVSLNGQQLVLNFTGLKGAQGDTGSSVDYPFTIVNNLTTDDATQALSAAQGVVLDGKVSQLQQEVSVRRVIDLSSLTKYNISIVPSTGLWGITTGVYSVFLPVSVGDTYQITATNGLAVYSILQSDAHINGTMCVPAAGHGYREPTIAQGESVTIKITAEDEKYICFRADTATTGAPAPDVVRITWLKDSVVPRSEIVQMIKGETSFGTSEIDFSLYELTQAAISGGTNVWVTNQPGSKGVFVPVIPNDTLTIIAGINNAIYAILTDNDHTDGATPHYATGWTTRKTLAAGASTSEVIPSNARYIWFFATADSVQGSLLPSSVTSADGVVLSYREKTAAQDAAIEALDDKVDSLESGASLATYFKESDFTPLSLNNHPLIYEGDDKANSNHICNAVAYPNGVIIAARPGSIVKIALDGTETTLLTCSGSSDWRGLWMDSNYNVYASPFNSVNSNGDATDIGNGIYRLPYGSDTFTRVMSLSPGKTIWTFCEDKDGYIYGGSYQILPNTNEAILYRSADGGITWSAYYNFISGGASPSGRHVHSVIYNEYNDALYVIIGEVNDILKSTDHGTSWVSLGVTLNEKGSSMLATPYGILIGSDGAYFCDIDLLYPDDATHKRVSRAWADTVFAIRKSDISDNIYAFCKIDSSVMSSAYYPQMADVSDTASLTSWINSNPQYLAKWQEYHSAMQDIYPDDAVRPQHYMLLMSEDFGRTWKVIYREAAGAINADGLWTIGYFQNGECLIGRVKSTSSSLREYAKPLVISEGRHRYTNSGMGCEGDIFIRTNSNTIVTPL